MSTWFTSDSHFYHDNILKYCPNRGMIWKNADEMNEGLIEKWNKTKFHFRFKSLS